MYRIFSIGILGLTLSACGGGGGSTPGPSQLSGTFHLMSYQAGPGGLQSAWGTASADGAGNFTVTGSRLKVGDNPPISSTPTITYESTLGAGNSLALAFAGTSLLAGGFSGDGQVAVLTSVAETSDPTLLILIRTTSGAGPGIFSGNYWEGSFVTAFGTAATFGIGNADGGALFNLVSGTNVAGTIGPASNTVYGYTVGPVGESTLFAPSEGYRGAITGDGAFAAWAGNTDPAAAVSFPHLRVAVRGGTSSNASFNGTYHMAVMEFDLGATANRSFQGVATADGAGGMTATGMFNTNGSMGGGSIGASFNVDTNTNLMTLNRTGLTENIGGVVSPDGRFVVLSGGGTTNSNPILMVLVRQ